MKVKGNIIKARIGYVTERFGKDGWQRVLVALSQADRKVLGGIVTNSAWYPFDLATRLDETIVNVLGHGSASIFEEMGRASARENLTGVHRNLLTPGDPAAFMAKCGMIYKFYYDIGDRTWEASGPTSGVLTTRGAETFSTADCATVIGWYKEALEMCGARRIEIVEEECRARGGTVCRYSVRWQG